MKKWVVCMCATMVALLVVVAIVYGCLFKVHPLNPNGDVVEVQYISYQDENIELSDENKKQIAEILSSASCKRQEGQMPSGGNAERLVEIDGLIGDDSMHIVLGDYNYYYESAGSYKWFELEDGDEIKDKILEIISNADQ